MLAVTRRFAVAVLIVVLAAYAVRAEPNLFTNPGFEKGGEKTPGWWNGFSGDGGAWRWQDNGQARSGRGVAAIGCGHGTVGGTGYWGQTLARVTPNQQLDFSIWMRTETGFQGRVWLIAEFKDSAGKFLLTNASAAVSDEHLAYTPLALRTEPGPTGTAEVAFQIRVVGSRQSAMFDDARAAYVDHPDAALGRPIPAEELTAWKEAHADRTPARWRTRKLDHGGWTIALPDGTSFLPVGIDYEPLALYDGIDWPGVERDLDLIRESGFNTLSVWCTGFHCVTCTTRHLTFEEMAGLAERARDRGLHIQFYLNIDRFTDLFPRAGRADGSLDDFDIDYADPAYREFCRNYARRLAMALHPYDNAVTIIVWEEKVGLNADFGPDRPRITALYASEAGKAGFEAWLRNRHGSLSGLNAAWGTAYPSFREAVDRSLLDYLNGVPKDDHRQFDVLEYAEVLLIDFTREFVAAYKEVDPTMLFECRHFDLFGPVHPLHPGLGFLDTFGINNYTLGHRGPDFSFREEYIRAKLVAGIAETAPTVGNFGFRSKSDDGATHGLVTSEVMKAHFGADSVAAYSFIPELAGSSYLMYLCPGWEGPWGIVLDDGRAKTPLFHSFQAVHALMGDMNREIARADYARRPQIHVFHGLDAMFDLKPMGWIQHPELSFDLAEMNVDYGVITDTDEFRPTDRPVILALFHPYDRKLDSDVAARLGAYARQGGTLVIANTFGLMDRYLWSNPESERLARRLRGIDIGRLRYGDATVSGEGLPEVLVRDTCFVEADPRTLDRGAEVLLTMTAHGIEQPALIRRTYGQGTVYYFLFNPFRQEIWTGEPGKENRASLPVMAFLCRKLGIETDDRLGNRGFDLANGRVNIHEKLVHTFLNTNLAAAGKYEDEYGETEEFYSGGVFTENFLSFRGRRCEERGWSVDSPTVTSIGAAVTSNSLSFFTLDATSLTLRKGPWDIRQQTEPCRVYRVPLPAAPAP